MSEQTSKALALRQAVGDIFREMGPRGYLPQIGEPRTKAVRQAMKDFDAAWAEGAEDVLEQVYSVLELDDSEDQQAVREGWALFGSGKYGTEIQVIETPDDPVIELEPAMPDPVRLALDVALLNLPLDSPALQAVRKARATHVLATDEEAIWYCTEQANKFPASMVHAKALARHYLNIVERAEASEATSREEE